MVEGAHTIAAIILETVVGTNGILVPPDGYLQGVRDLCDEHGIVLIADEVMAGFGRCGEWFAVDHWGVRPDLITFAKGVNSGYVPLGGVVISDEIRATFDQRAFPGGLTYSGHPLACASAVASINAFREEGIIENARMLGTDVIGPRLREIAEKHPSVGDVRGLGVFWAVELVRDRGTREPLVPYNAAGDGGQADGRLRRGLQGARALAVHPLQPDPRRAAVHDDPGRGAGGARDPRRGAVRRRRVHRLTTPTQAVCRWARSPSPAALPHLPPLPSNVQFAPPRGPVDCAVRAAW